MNGRLTVVQGPGGGFEVGSGGIPSPPPSPDAAPFERPGLKARKRSGGAAYTITEECERLFCETLKAVFLGEGNARSDSLEMGMRSSTTTATRRKSFGRAHVHGLPTPSPSPADGQLAFDLTQGFVKEWVEIWDYAGGLRFRAFVAERMGSRTLFVFFDQEVIGKDLKQGYVRVNTRFTAVR